MTIICITLLILVQLNPPLLEEIYYRKEEYFMVQNFKTKFIKILTVLGFIVVW